MNEWRYEEKNKKKWKWKAETETRRKSQTTGCEEMNGECSIKLCRNVKNVQQKQGKEKCNKYLQMGAPIKDVVEE